MREQDFAQKRQLKLTKSIQMERYPRWQALSITQTSVLVSLLSALSLAGLSTSLSLVQNKDFIAALDFRGSLACAFIMYSLCMLFSTLTVLSRTMDFRLTAREVRRQTNLSYSRPTKLFGISSSGFGGITWFSVWSSFFFFCAGSLALAIAVISVYFPLHIQCSAA